MGPDRGWSGTGFPGRRLVSLLVVVLALSLLALPVAAHYPGLIYYPPTTDDDALYVGGTDGVLYRLDAAGVPEWRYFAGMEITAPPARGDTRVFVPTADGRVVGVWKANGTEAWQTPLSRERVHPATIASNRGTVYVVTKRTVYALSARGETEWTFTAEDAFFSAVAVADDRVYVADDRENGSLYAFASNGTRLWRTPYRNPGAVAATDDRLYAGANDSLVALAPDGRERWRVETGELWTRPAVGRSLVVAGTFDGGLVAVRNGTVVWTHPMETPAAATVDGGRVYAVTPEGVVAVEDGRRLWRREIGPTVLLPPAVGDHVYVGTQLNRTYALHKNGSVAWINEYATTMADVPWIDDVEVPPWLGTATGEATRVVAGPPSLDGEGDRVNPTPRPTDGGPAGPLGAVLAGVLGILGVAALLVALSRRRGVS